MRTIRQIHESLKKKEFSALELAKETLQRAKTEDQKLGSFLHFSEELALEQAASAEALLAEEKEPCWLTGVPFGIKDVIITKDVPTTAASKILEGFVPPYSAKVYENLLAVKGVMLGKNNCDEFAMGA